MHEGWLGSILFNMVGRKHKDKVKDGPADYVYKQSAPS